MTQQGDRQASLRTITGKALTYEGDWHALWDFVSVAAGTFDERMTAYVNLKLGTAYTNVNDAMQALATNQGAFNFSSMGTFTASVGVFITGSPPFATNGAAYSWTPNIGGGTGPYVVTLLSGALPTGTSIVANVVTGTVSATGTFSGVLRVTDALSNHADLPFSIISSNALVLTNSPTLSIGISSAYSYTPTTTGGRAPITWAITNKPSWASFSTSTGALTGTTPGTGETDSGITIVGTDADGRTVTTGAFTITVSAVVAITEAIYDNFAGVAATLVNGRSTTQGGGTWSVIHGSVVTSTGHAVNGNGDIYTNAAQSNFTVIAAGYSDNFWVTRRTSPFWNTTQSSPQIANPIHLSYTGDGTTNLWTKTCAGFGGLAGANTTMRTFSTGSTAVAANTAAANADANIAFVQVEAGDTHSVRHRKVGGSLFLDTYQNNHLFQLGAVDMAANGSPLNGNVGFGASVSYPSASRVFTDIWIGDPTAVGFITVDGICRVRQINADGSCDFQLHGEYSQYAPTALTWSMFNVSGGSSEVPVVNVTSVAVSSLSTTAPVNSVGTWKGTVHVAAADLPTLFTHRVERTLPSGTVIYGYSGVERPGYVFSLSGQSLQTHEIQTTGSGMTATGWIVQGSDDTSIGAVLEQDRRTQRSGTTIFSSKFMNTFAGVVGVSDLLSLAYISEGHGGTYFRDPATAANGRNIGTATYTALTEGLMRGGNRICCHFETLGQFEGSNSGSAISGGFTANTTYQASLEADLIAAWNDMEDRLGLTRGTMPIVMVPVNQFNTISAPANTDYEAVRRFQKYMVAKYAGSRAIYDGPITYDIVHASTDPYHFSVYDEQARRKAYSALKILGKSALDRNGPTMKAVTRVSASQVDIQYNMTGGDTMEIVNGGAVAASGFDGGHRFFVGTGLGGSQVHATAAALKGGTIDTISFTFAANTFPGVVSVGGPNGSNPFNPTNDGGVTGSGINALANWATQACMVREHWASEPSLPLRPYYDTAGLTTGGGFNPANTNDYMSAS